MCGIVGLFLKDKSLEPQLGSMLSEMLISLSDRGPDSAGIAIYGAPSGNAGQDHHPVGRARARFPRARRRTRQGDRRAGERRREVHARRRHDDHRQGRRGARGDRRRCVPTIRIMGAGEVVEIYKEVGLPGDGRRSFRRPRHDRHARHRPYPHGDGIGGDDDGRASVLDRRRPVPGAQRLAVQPQQCAPRADPRRHDIRDRERHRGRGRLPLVARWRTARISARRWKAR